MKLILWLALAFSNYQYTSHRVVPSEVLANNSKPGDSSWLRISNMSSLKKLPSVLRDLTIALRESSFMEQGFLNVNGFTIDLDDALCRNFNASASVTYHPGDTVYHLTLNRFNKLATDKALAVTLIHEFIHCVLLDIDRRARSGNKSALALVNNFNEKIKSPYPVVANKFFDLMNRDDIGQHELMYQLFLPGMVCLLEQFAEIHRILFFQHEEAEQLIWSGLQNTTGFKQLALEDKNQIQMAIMREKGLPIAVAEY